MKKPVPALPVAVAVVFIWAETFVSTKILIGEGLAPAEIFMCRFVLAYLLCWTVSPKRFFSESLLDEVIMLLLGISGGSLYFLAENTALACSTASNVGILVCSAPLLTALLMSVPYKEERLNSRQLIGSLIAFCGVGLVVMNGQFVLHLNPLGDILAITAALTWAFYSLLIKKVSSRYDVRFITRKVFGYGVLTILPYFIFKPFSPDPGVFLHPVVWGNLVYLGIVASFLCFLTWNWCLDELGTVRTTNLIYCQPFFTMLIAWFWLGEKISVMAVVGTIILIFGLSLMARWRKS